LKIWLRQAYCKDKNLTDDDLLYIQNKVKVDCKRDFANYVSTLGKGECDITFEPLRDFIGKIKAELLNEKQPTESNQLKSIDESVQCSFNFGQDNNLPTDKSGGTTV
jgi:hypothetical protein